MYGSQCEEGYTTTHQPGANLDYGFNYSGRLLTGETIDSSTWALVEPTSEVTLTRDQVAGAITSVFVGGGVNDKDYQIKNTVVTAAPHSRTYVRIMTLRCRDNESC